MPSCIVKGCNFQWKNRDPNIILHSFPSNVDIIRAWLLQTSQELDTVDQMCHKILVATKGQYRICSQHFTPDCYYQRGMLVALKKEALPTIFPDQAAIEEKARRAKTRRRRSKVPPPDDPPTLDSASGSNASPPLVGGFPLRDAKVNHPYPLPNMEPMTYPSLIAEDGYYISAESFIQKQTKLSELGLDSSQAIFPSKRRKFPTRNTEYFPSQTPKPPLPNKHGVKHKAVQTDISAEDGIPCNCKCKERGSQAGRAPSAMVSEGETGQVTCGAPSKTLGPGLPSDAIGIKKSSTVREDHPSTDSPIMEKTPVMISIGCGSDSDIGSFSVKLEDDENGERVAEAAIKTNEVNAASVEILVTNRPHSPTSENRYVVINSCLDRLLMQCRCLADERCNGRIQKLEKNLIGSSLSVRAECSNRHQFHMWDSQP